MSIWCSWEDIGYERLNPRARGGPNRGEVRSYASGWSNHYPDRKVERPASVSVANIPVWCVPGHDEEFDDAVGPWLRLDVDTEAHDINGKPTGERIHAAVVIDEEAARALAADLLRWADAPKATPLDPGAGQ